MLYLWIVAAGVAAVISQDCAFIPEPITPSNDTTVVQVDCQRRQPGNITGENTGVVVYVVNCKTVPVGLFINVSETVSTVAVLSNDSEELVKGTFVGLANIAELRLEGFKTLRSLSRDVFRPLRSLERLLLVGFGAHRLSFAELGAALHGLSGTPLSRIVMHEIHSFRNEKNARRQRPAPDAERQRSRAQFQRQRNYCYFGETISYTSRLEISLRRQ